MLFHLFAILAQCRQLCQAGSALSPRFLPIEETAQVPMERASKQASGMLTV